MATSDATELQVNGRAVRLSSPGKVLFASGITKLDVAQYVIAVGDGILAALRDRPTALERWPKGFRRG